MSLHKLPQLTLKRSLISIETAADALDKTHGEVLALIENGSLLWAWNISPKNSRARVVRILTQCLVDFQTCQRAKAQTEDEALQLAFPTLALMCVDSARLRAKAIARLLGLKSETVLKLISDGLLRAAPNTQWRRGPGGSPEVEFSSVVKFLKQRRIV